MKYIDSEKLIAEIERRIDLICTTEGVVQRDKLQEYKALRDIGDFITSLQQEQPEADLEKFISDFFDKKDAENNGRWSEDDIVEAITNAYELGKARKEESK